MVRRDDVPYLFASSLMVIMGGGGGGFPGSYRRPAAPGAAPPPPPRRRNPRASGGSSNYFFLRWSDGSQQTDGVPCPLPCRYAPAPSPSARRRNPRGALLLRSYRRTTTALPRGATPAPARRGLSSGFRWFLLLSNKNKINMIKG